MYRGPLILHLAGIAKEYEMDGLVNYHIKWKKGQRVGTDAIVKHGGRR